MKKKIIFALISIWAIITVFCMSALASYYSEIWLSGGWTKTCSALSFSESEIDSIDATARIYSGGILRDVDYAHATNAHSVQADATTSVFGLKRGTSTHTYVNDGVVVTHNLSVVQ